MEDSKNKGYNISYSPEMIENFYNFNPKVKALRDTALFAMNIMIVARYFGLETHPIEGFNESELRKFLNIEDYKDIPLIISIGYKDKSRELLPQLIRFEFETFGKII